MTTGLQLLTTTVITAEPHWSPIYQLKWQNASKWLKTTESTAEPNWSPHLPTDVTDRPPTADNYCKHRRTTLVPHLPNEMTTGLQLLTTTVSTAEPHWTLIYQLKWQKAQTADNYCKHSRTILVPHLPTDATTGLQLLTTTVSTARPHWSPIYQLKWQKASKFENYCKHSRTTLVPHLPTEMTTGPNGWQLLSAQQNHTGSPSTNWSDRQASNCWQLL